MRSFREHQIHELTDSLDNCDIREGVENQLEILRLRLIESSKLPKLIIENLSEQSEWNLAVENDHRLQRYVIDNTMRFAKQTLYEALMESDGAAAPSLDALRDEIEAKVSAMFDAIKSTVMGGMKASRGTATSPADEPAADAEGGSAPGSGSGLPPTGGHARDAGAPPAGGSPRGGVMGAGPSGSGATHSPPAGDESDPTFSREHLPQDRPEVGGYKPASLGSFLPGARSQGEPWWKRLGGALRRSIIDPIANWGPIKKFRRRWHNDPTRPMAKEARLHFNSMLLESEMDIDALIDQAKMDFMGWLDDRLEQFAAAIKMPYTKRGTASPTASAGVNGPSVPGDGPEAANGVDIPVSTGNPQEDEELKTGTNPDALSDDVAATDELERSTNPEHRMKAHQIKELHMQNFDAGLRAMGMQPMFNKSKAIPTSKGSLHLPTPYEYMAFIKNQAGEDIEATPASAYEAKPGKAIGKSAKGLWGEILRRAYQATGGKNPNPRVSTIATHLMSTLGGLNHFDDRYPNRILELVLKVGAWSRGGGSQGGTAAAHQSPGLVLDPETWAAGKRAGASPEKSTMQPPVVDLDAKTEPMAPTKAPSIEANPAAPEAPPEETGHLPVDTKETGNATTRSVISHLKSTGQLDKAIATTQEFLKTRGDESTGDPLKDLETVLDNTFGDQEVPPEKLAKIYGKLGVTGPEAAPAAPAAPGVTPGAEAAPEMAPAAKAPAAQPEGRAQQLVPSVLKKLQQDGDLEHMVKASGGEDQLKAKIAELLGQEPLGKSMADEDAGIIALDKEDQQAIMNAITKLAQGNFDDAINRKAADAEDLEKFAQSKGGTSALDDAQLFARAKKLLDAAKTGDPSAKQNLYKFLSAQMKQALSKAGREEDVESMQDPGTPLDALMNALDGDGNLEKEVMNVAHDIAKLSKMTGEAPEEEAGASDEDMDKELQDLIAQQQADMKRDGGHLPVNEPEPEGEAKPKEPKQARGSTMSQFMKDRKARKSGEGKNETFQDTIELYKKLLREGVRPTKSRVQELREQLLA